MYKQRELDRRGGAKANKRNSVLCRRAEDVVKEFPEYARKRNKQFQPLIDYGLVKNVNEWKEFESDLLVVPQFCYKIYQLYLLILTQVMTRRLFS